MKPTYIRSQIILALVMISCGGANDDQNNGHQHESNNPEESLSNVHLSENQVAALNITFDSLPKRNIKSYVEANGELTVPPQSEAIVTAIIGANIRTINVIEGERVRKGQTLATISHPDLIKLQTDYITNWNELSYLKSEYERQEKMYTEKINSGKELEKTKSEFKSKEGLVLGLEAQLKLLGLDLERLRNNELYQRIYVVSPIAGYVRMVNVKIGQYVNPDQSMFEIVNIEHVHADLMVFEKDVYKIKEGQRVRFSVESIPDAELEATIFSVGKTFEHEPKAVHIHADIENKEGLLIPGMYVRGQIDVDNNLTYALPEDGIVRDGDQYYMFTVSRSDKHDEWIFEPTQIQVGNTNSGWTEVILSAPLKPGTIVAMDHAYTLFAEMKKDEAEHNH